jgi:hypothetical protein
MIDFAATATETIGNGGAMAGFFALGWGLIELLKRAIETRKQKKRDSDRPPRDLVNHGPCNEAVDNLTDAIREDSRDRKSMHGEEIREQQAFRRAFENWMAREEGRREGSSDLRRTADGIPVGR